jgi:hypothetical protein
MKILAKCLSPRAEPLALNLDGFVKSPNFPLLAKGYLTTYAYPTDIASLIPSPLVGSGFG